MQLCLNGKFLEEEDAWISPLDNGFLYGDGFYDTMRSYSGIVLDLDLHLERIIHSSKALDIPLKWSEFELEKWIKKMAKDTPWDSARIRVTITRGVHGFDFVGATNPTLLITSEEVKLDPRVYEKGISVHSMLLQRICPELKTLSLITMTLAQRDMLSKKTQEVLLVDEKKYVTEGATSNIFMIKDGVLYTPKKNVLIGVSRNRVIELVKRSGLSVQEKNLKMSFLMQADEVFLTNSVREIVPVVIVDGVRIGSGKVGAYTKRIMAFYKVHVESLL